MKLLLALAASLVLTNPAIAAAVTTDHFDIKAKGEVFIGQEATLVISARNKEGQLVKNAKHDLRVIVTTSQKASEEKTIQIKKGGQAEVKVPVLSYNLIVQVIDQKTGRIDSDIIPAKVSTQKGAVQ